MAPMVTLILLNLYLIPLMVAIAYLKCDYKDRNVNSDEQLADFFWALMPLINFVLAYNYFDCREK